MGPLCILEISAIHKENVGNCSLKERVPRPILEDRMGEKSSDRRSESSSAQRYSTFPFPFILTRTEYLTIIGSSDHRIIACSFSF